MSHTDATSDLIGLPVYAHYARRHPLDDPADWLGEETDPAVEAPAGAVV